MRGAMTRSVLVGLVGLGLLPIRPVIRASTRPVVVEATRIHTVTQGVVENGTIVIRDGRIAAVGQDVPVPADAERHRAEVVIPGMIDAHTHMALDRTSDRSPGPVTAEWKAVDHLQVDDPMIQVALSGGLTTVITRPGSGIVSSGQSVAIKLRSDPSRGLVLKPYADLKMAVRPLAGLRPGESPATVMGWYAIASDHFRRARAYLEAQAAFEHGARPTRPPTDARLEAFAAVLRGDVMVHAHSHYPSEIQMVLRLAREFGFLDRLALGHASEAFPIAALLAKTNVIPVVGPVMIVRFFGDRASHNVVKELMDAGVRASIQTDQAGEQLKSFREYGAMLVRHGLGEAQALEAMTINGAHAMMLADRVGSIEVGKDADLVLMDGPPFDLHAERITKVFVDGVLEYERSSPRQPDRPTSVGPFERMRGLDGLSRDTFGLVNAHLLTVSGANIRDGHIVVRDGKIAAVGPGRDVPADVPLVDVGGRVVMPGWITARAFPNTWIGDLKWQVQNDENLDPITPQMNARYGVDPWFPSFAALREIGVTSQHITPGHLNLIGGTGVAIKTAGVDVDEMVRREPSALVLSLTGESLETWARDSQIPLTLPTVVETLRDTLGAARRYLESPDETFDARFEALRAALEGRIPVVIQANLESEIRAGIAFVQEFGLRGIVSGGVQAYRLAAELAAADIPVILGDSASDLERIRGGGPGFDDRAPALLSQAGVRVSFYGPSGSRRGMPTGRLGGEPALNAAWVFRNGVPESEALRMFTLNAAEMMGMADRIGSLDIGKDADLIVLAGHPFDYRALPDLVVIDGRIVHRARGEN